MNTICFQHAYLIELTPALVERKIAALGNNDSLGVFSEPLTN